MIDIPTPTSTPDAVAFRHVETWIFDLDNTLYPASCNLFAQVDRRITDYIAARFDMEWQQAYNLQKLYFRTYGTTLRGLMTEHDMDPRDFLEYVHDIDLAPVDPSPVMERALSRLPGRKIIYTNGSVRHAENVLGKLGVAGHFEAIFDVVAADYVPKPDPRPYSTLIDRHGIDPRAACMVEDIARNLVPAAAMGMSTVWVTGEVDWAKPEAGGIGAGRHIHHATADLVAWLDHLSRELAGSGA